MKSNTTIPLARPKSRVFPLVAAIVLAGLASAASAQQQARQGPARAEPAAPAKDYNQRALEIYEFRKAAQSGPERGQEIYFYKCWMCHNEFAQGGAPKLVGLFKRPTLVSGDPVNDDTVKTKILNGSANMPAYKHVLGEADLADLMSWLRDEKCCWNSDSPPLNPRYKGANAPGARPELYGALSGGPKGLVKNARGEPIEGIMVQLISDETAIRTTVYSRERRALRIPPGRAPAPTRCASPSRRSSIRSPRPRWRSRATKRSTTSRCIRVTPGEFLPPFPADRGAAFRARNGCRTCPAPARRRRR